jgi:uncharacterized membrane protein YkoI
MLRAIKPGIIAAVAVMILSVGGATAQQGCVEWSKAGPIIAQNGLIAANVIYQKVQKQTGGKIVNQALCNVGGRYVYKLVVLGPTGEVTNLTVDAKTGQF